MPDPLCDLACQTKIIINGDSAARILDATCEGFERFLDHGGTLQHTDKLLAQLVIMENEVYRFQRLVMESMGYAGPWPKCLQ